MTSEQFVYWLQGYAELSGERPTAEQWQSIKEHLGLVLNKVTPKVTAPSFQYPSVQLPVTWPDSEITC